ncbi:uncharacterized protein KY384_008118 [Bacidia gigantensis]|uniref:uncharacterized protein n=1 Tax=Bacidia gigantensis TaxID=2732470 RepID=UPI001D055773|nr:uncharacterized protein KY384_008118 [Bacidia gigantensis]KAG8526689.1 hypothetical protein KY384_008118 [Bacidia gigantensis]
MSTQENKTVQTALNDARAEIMSLRSDTAHQILERDLKINDLECELERSRKRCQLLEDNLQRQKESSLSPETKITLAEIKNFTAESHAFLKVQSEVFQRLKSKFQKQCGTQQEKEPAVQRSDEMVTASSGERDFSTMETEGDRASHIPVALTGRNEEQKGKSTLSKPFDLSKRSIFEIDGTKESNLDTHSHLPPNVSLGAEHQGAKNKKRKRDEEVSEGLNTDPVHT